MILILLAVSYLNLNFALLFFKNRFNYRYHWKIKLEDIIVVDLAIFSLILIGFKYLYLPLQLKLVVYLAVSLNLAVGLLWLVCFKFKIPKSIAQLHWFNFAKIKLANCSWFIGIFLFYLLRALLKAKNFSEVVYIPSRYNTDIFLYLRRISVFLGEQTYKTHQYNSVTAQDILYDSPKLLSSFIYAVFTNIFQSQGIAGTVLTSLILTAVTVKYILLLNNSYFSRLFYAALITFILFFPAFSWLQDQFYLSNLLYLYLLIYALENLLLLQKFDSQGIFKYAVSAIAIAGFYPSQLPFLAISAVSLIILIPQQLASKTKYILKICGLTTAAIVIFLPQYTATSEVVQHFNLTDSQHGVNFSYVPFWSLLSIMPKPGGFKANLSSIALVIGSILVTILVTWYLAKKNSHLTKHLYLSASLYIVYSLSFIFFSGSYRQGKFLITYIIPLSLFCAIKIITAVKINNKVATAVALVLACYVAWNSLDRKYKSHISYSTQQTINQIKKQNQPTAFYYQTLDHRYYYLSYQLQDYALAMIQNCPSIKEIESQTALKQTLVIDSSCSSDASYFAQNNVIQLDFSR